MRRCVDSGNADMVQHGKLAGQKFHSAPHAPLFRGVDLLEFRHRKPADRAAAGGLYEKVVGVFGARACWVQ